MSEYQNPIERTRTVVISNWEYSALLRSAHTLQVIDKLYRKCDTYEASRITKIILEDGLLEDTDNE